MLQLKMQMRRLLRCGKSYKQHKTRRYKPRQLRNAQVRHFQVLHFQVLLFGPSFSGPEVLHFQALWIGPSFSRSCIFRSCIFSRPNSTRRRVELSCVAINGALVNRFELRSIGYTASVVRCESSDVAYRPNPSRLAVGTHHKVLQPCLAASWAMTSCRASRRRQLNEHDADTVILYVNFSQPHRL